MDKEFCLSALERAMRIHEKPEVFNSDKGHQFTNEAFREKLENNGVKISADDKDRTLDNIVIERFWRTIKYEEVYLKDYENPIEAVHGISKYIETYNTRRPHDSLGKRTPDEVYFETSVYGLNQSKIS